MGYFHPGIHLTCPGGTEISIQTATSEKNVITSSYDVNIEKFKNTQKYTKIKLFSSSFQLSKFALIKTCKEAEDGLRPRVRCSEGCK